MTERERQPKADVIAYMTNVVLEQERVAASAAAIAALAAFVPT